MATPFLVSQLSNIGWSPVLGVSLVFLLGGVALYPVQETLVDDKEQDFKDSLI